MSRTLRRAFFAVLVVFGIFVMNRPLSDGRRSVAFGDPAPPLWVEAVHADRPHARQSEGTRITFSEDANPAVNCPMVLSLDRDNPYRFTSMEQGVQFDIDADGDLDQVSWPEADAGIAFLARDRNDDGRITDGRELFGDRMLPGARSGPKALISLATAAASGEPGAGLDSRNPLFARLLLWTDANHNGLSETSELRAAGEVLSAVGLGFERHHRVDNHGNESRYRGFVVIRTEPGLNAPTTRDQEFSRGRPIYDVCLATGG
jgi:hypothetical protein